MAEIGVFIREKENNFHRAKQLFLSVTAVIFVSSLYLFDPADSFFYVPCPFHLITGFYCPGCGSLRAIHELLHMRFISAFKLNPLLVASIPLLAYLTLRLHFSRSGKYSLKLDIPAFPVLIYLVIIILFWIIRNIPANPLSLSLP